MASYGSSIGAESNVQLEKRIGNLQHQHVWVVMFVADQHPLTGAPHAMQVIMFL